MFSQVCVKNSVHRGVAGGHAWVGHAWQGGVHGRGVHVWQRWYVWQGTCLVEGCAWRGGGAACVAGETATAADGTHPTGMHSCSVMLSHSDLINGLRLIIPMVRHFCL